ncbi:MAG TPA: hypothetical protein VLT33_29165, partial [Labilithrix sp.]|nr:hypothetical protein [Labilithrix sp.]
SRDEQERMMEALERARRPWPLDPLLAITVVAALALGVLRGAQESRASRAAGGVATLLRWRTIGGVAAALVVAMGLILVLRPLGVPH